MIPRPHYSSDDSMKKEQYQRLLTELQAMIEQTQAAELDLTQRAHLLTCSDCGAYEDINEDEQMLVYDQEEEVTLYPEFIIIEGKQRVYEKAKQSQYLTSYTFICPVCGMYQTAIIREKFEEEFDT